MLVSLEALRDLMHGTRNPVRPRTGFGQPDPRTGTVLVELRTANGVALVEYSCSSRVVPLNSSSFCSTRCAPAVPFAPGVPKPSYTQSTSFISCAVPPKFQLLHAARSVVPCRLCTFEP